MTNELLPSTAMVPPREQRGSRRPGRTALVLGVVAIVAVAAAAIVTLAGRDDASSDPLLMLPSPAVDWQLTDGAIANQGDEPPATAERFITSGELFGVVEDDGYVELRSLIIYPDSPFPGAVWEATRQTGTSRRVDDSITLANDEPGSGELGSYWRVASSPSDLIHATDALSGSFGNDTTLIAVFEPPKRPAVSSTSFEMTSADGTTFAVETAFSASPLFEAATFAERVEPIDVNGTPGWVIADEGEAGDEITVAWSPENDRTVVVRSIAPRATVIEAAQALEPVSQDEWNAVFPS